MWGNYGNAGWIAFPPQKNPQRIVLSDALIDATWRIQLSYLEDCKSLPTEVLAGLLGISTDLLVDYFAGGALPGVGGQQVSDLISQNLLQPLGQRRHGERLYKRNADRPEDRAPRP